MKVPVQGRDFYTETRVNIEKYVHPDDREFAKNLHCKETMLQNLKDRKSYSYKYRLMINGQPKYFQFTVIRANDDKHFVLYEKDIDDEITAENMRLENQKCLARRNRVRTVAPGSFKISPISSVE